MTRLKISISIQEMQRYYQTLAEVPVIKTSSLSDPKIIIALSKLFL